MDKIDITEVKLLLDSYIALCGGFELCGYLRDSFNIKKPGADMKIWYIETKNRDLDKHGWLVRYRYHEGCDFELTYKKRFSEAEYNTAGKNEIESLRKFKPEIDMGIDNRTYSFSYVKLFNLTDRLFDLKLNDAKSLAVENCPDALADMKGKGTGKIFLEESVMYGPVKAMEYKGEYHGVEASIEVWKLDGFLTELSFKVDTAKSRQLLEHLIAGFEKDNKMRLVRNEERLKTKALLDYYSRRGINADTFASV